MSIIEVFKKKIYLSSPTMHGEEMNYVNEAFETNWIAPLGENVNEFEKEIANYIGTSSAAALVSGTSAIHLAMKLCGVRQGDVVFCSDLTFAATVNPITYEGGIPVLIDSERETWNMDPELLEKAFLKYDGIQYPKPKAVVIANLYGVPAKLDRIKDICKNFNTPLVEDAAESLGALYNSKQTGTFGDYSIVSFNGNKIITTSGGGMLLSDDVDAIAKARFWATQARDEAVWYQHSEIGYNYRMSNVVAGIGRGQLIHLDEHIRLKKEIYNRYKEGFKSLPITMNPYLDNSEPNYWLSCFTIDKGSNIEPMDILLELKEFNVECRPIWKPMHMQPVFENNDFISNNNVGRDIFERGLCLPSDIKMTEEEQNIIIDIIRGMFNV